MFVRSNLIWIATCLRNAPISSIIDYTLANILPPSRFVTVVKETTLGSNLSSSYRSYKEQGTSIEVHLYKLS